MSWSDLPEWQREYVSVLFRGDDAAARRFESSGFLKDNFGSDGNVVSFIALQRANRQLDPNSESALEDAGVLAQCALDAGFRRAAERIFRRIPGPRRAIHDGRMDPEAVEYLSLRPPRVLAPSRSAHGFVLEGGEASDSASIRRTVNRLRVRTTRVPLPDKAPSSAEELFSILDRFSAGRNRLHMSALVMEWDETRFPLAVLLGRLLLIPLVVADYSEIGGRAGEFAREHGVGLVGAVDAPWWAPVMSLDMVPRHESGPIIRELTTDVRFDSHHASGQTTAMETALRVGWILRDGDNYGILARRHDTGLDTMPFRWFAAEINRRRESGVFGPVLLAMVAEFLWKQPVQGRFRLLQKRCELWSLKAPAGYRRALSRTARHLGEAHYPGLVQGAKLADSAEYRRASNVLSRSAQEGHLAAMYLFGECRAAADLSDEILRGSTEDGRPEDVRPEKIVCILHASTPYQSGGYAIRAHGILQVLTRAGIDITAVTRPGFPAETGDGEFRPENVVDGVRYRHIEASRVERSVGEARHMASFVDDFVEVLRTTGATKVHVRSTFLIAIPAIIAAHRLGLKVVYEISGLWELVYAERESQHSLLRRAPMAEHFEILAARHADSVVVMNEPVRQLSIERGVVQEHLRVAPNAVDVEKFAPSADSSGSVVGFIGSFVDYEGIWLIVLAAAELLERGVEVQVRLVGDGSEYPRVEKLVDEMGLADHVMLTGRVPHDQVIREYEEIDILVYPRLPTAATTTITPLKPFEAFAMEKAVVVSDVPPLREIAGDGTRALVFPPGDVSSLADALERLLSDPGLRRRLGSRAREWVARERSWDQVVQTFREAYSDL